MPIRSTFVIVTLPSAAKSAVARIAVAGTDFLAGMETKRRAPTASRTTNIVLKKKYPNRRRRNAASDRGCAYQKMMVTTSAPRLAVQAFTQGRSSTRSVKRVELRPWVNAWTANLGALVVTIIFWYAQPRSEAAFLLLRFGYFFFKTMFVVLLAVGARRFVSMPARKSVPATAILATALFAALGSVTMTKVDLIGIYESLAIAVVLGAAGWNLLLHRSPGAG